MFHQKRMWKQGVIAAVVAMCVGGLQAAEDGALQSIDGNLKSVLEAMQSIGAELEGARSNASVDPWPLSKAEQAAIDQLRKNGRTEFAGTQKVVLTSNLFLNLLSGVHLPAQITSIVISNAVIKDALLTRNAPITLEIQMLNCEFKERVVLRNCRFSTGLHFRRCRFEKEVDFQHSEFGGGLEAYDCDFEEEALFEGIVVKRSLELGRSRFHQPARFKHAQVGHDIDANQAVFLQGAKFVSMHVGGHVNAYNARVGVGADFKDSRVDGDFGVGAMDVSGEFRLHNLVVGGLLHGPNLTNRGNLNFHGTQVSRGCYLENSRINGEADFESMSVGGQFFFNSARFESIVKFSHARMEGPVFAVGASFAEALNFKNAYIGGECHFERAVFGKRVDFSQTRMEGPVFARNAVFARGFKLHSATIGGGLALREARITGEADFTELAIGGALAIHAGDKHDSIFESPEKVKLDQLRYGRINAGKDRMARKRALEFIERADQGEFRPDSYIQLENRLRASGMESDADKVFIAMKRRERDEPWNQGGVLWIYLGMQDVFTRYGKEPGRVLFGVLFFILLGGLAFPESRMEPREDEDEAKIPKYDQWAFSFDLLIPVMDLHRANVWQLKEGEHVFWKGYGFFHRIAGVVLTPATVAALTSAIQ